jgi:dTMP kinase
VGKSTQLLALADALRTRGIDVVTTREPGGSAGAEAIRELLLGGSGEDERWNPRAEALLFAAARSDHLVRTIMPALEGGHWVLCDRFLDSSLAYQGGAGGLGLDAIRSLHAIGSEGVLPDRTLVLVTAQGAERARARDGIEVDRIGGRGGAYHADVEATFLRIADEEPGRVRLIEADGAVEAVTERLMDALDDLL